MGDKGGQKFQKMGDVIYGHPSRWPFSQNEILKWKFSSEKVM